MLLEIETSPKIIFSFLVARKPSLPRATSRGTILGIDTKKGLVGSDENFLFFSVTELYNLKLVAFWEVRWILGKFRWILGVAV